MRLITAHLFTICALLMPVLAGKPPPSGNATSLDKRNLHTVTSIPRVGVKPKIIGGRPVNITDYPFMVSIQYYGKHICGATLFAPDWVLTAAHCLLKRDGSDKEEVYPKRPANRLVSLMASDDVRGKTRPPGAQEIVGSKVFPYRSYTRSHRVSDIGLIKLVKAFVLADGIQLTKMPEKSMQSIPPETFTKCYVTGWGVTKKREEDELPDPFRPKSLIRAEVVLISKKDCLKISSPLHITEICSGNDESGGNDPCDEDSGGPLVCADTQVGVISWGYGCGMEHRAGVYTRIDPYLNWLAEVMETGEDTGTLEFEIGEDIEVYDGTWDTLWSVMLVVIVVVAIVVTAVVSYFVYKAVISHRRTQSLE